ncbi:hypothetical protein CLU79DRAFT_884852 [Phycomyces nitens]|nr:hypothetical protein CLU79DRAFT_884852 [Phycomyces nitens]
MSTQSAPSSPRPVKINGQEPPRRVIEENLTADSINDIKKKNDSSWRRFVPFIFSPDDRFSSVNWGSSTHLLSKETAKNILATLPKFGEPAEPVIVSRSRSRVFDLDIAETAIALSALIYERNDELVKEAAEDQKSARSQGAEYSTYDYVITEEEITEKLKESEERIRDIAQTWGLSFTGVTELRSRGGAFCGMFWSETEPFIIVTFKGTSVTNYKDFLIDASLQRIDARPFVFGSAHKGFYESVFPSNGPSTQADLYRAAMSSLLFARFLKAPEDLPSTLCTLRDCYVIGSPAVGDNEFASSFASFSNSSATRNSTLWRIINQNDIVCRLPPGYNSQTIGNFSSRSDFFNYCHVGIGIRLKPKDKNNPISMCPSSYQPAMKATVRTQGYSSKIKPKDPVVDYPGIDTIDDLPPWVASILNQRHIKAKIDNWLSNHNRNLLQAIEYLYPQFLQDHIPHNYQKSLETAKRFYQEQDDSLHPTSN